MSNTITDPSLVWAKAPFDKETADIIILRSFDGVHFRVRRGILAEASAVFDDMFSHAQPSTSATLTCGDEMINGVPVIALDEQSKALDIVLRFYYPPYQNSQKLTVETLEVAVEATRKYFMDYAYKELIKHFQKMAEEGSGTLTYAIACKRRWTDEMCIAAKASLKQPWTNEPIPELKSISGLDYCYLFRYRQECTDAVVSAVKDPKFTWRSSGFTENYIPGSAIPAYVRQSRKLPHLWINVYMNAMYGQIKERPHSQVIYETALRLKLYRVTFEAGGLTDEVQLTDALELYLKELSNAIDAAISSVELGIA